jgi:hypothetical protein
MSENSQDYARKLQQNSTFINSASAEGALAEVFVFVCLSVLSKIITIIIIVVNV